MKRDILYGLAHIAKEGKRFRFFMLANLAAGLGVLRLPTAIMTLDLFMYVLPHGTFLLILSINHRPLNVLLSDHLTLAAGIFGKHCNYCGNLTLLFWNGCALLLSTPLTPPSLRVFFPKVSCKGLFPYSNVSSLQEMAEGNYREYLRVPRVRTKKYFYVLRPMLAWEWVLTRKGPRRGIRNAPVRFPHAGECSSRS